MHLKALVAAFASLAAIAPAAHADSRVLATGFTTARAVATGDDGSVFVGDDHGVTKLDPNGSKLRTYPSVMGVWDVAVDAAGNVYTGDWDSGAELRKYSPDGQLLWAKDPDLVGRALAVSDGRIYAADRDHVRIFDSATGEAIGSSPKLTERPPVWDVSARAGRVYAYSNGRLYTLDRDGTPIALDAPGRAEDHVRIDAGRDGLLRLTRFQRVVEVYDGNVVLRGLDDPPVPWDTAEFGDQVYFLSGGERLLAMNKSFELVPGGGALAPVADPGPGTPTPPEEAKRLPSVTLNGGELYTNDPRVAVHVVAPAGTTAIEAANDGGFAASRAFSAFGGLRWELARTGAERLPKTVYVRFLPSGQTVSDDIILDQTAPTLVRATATRSGKRYTLRLKARDTTSGIATLQVIGKKSRSYLRYSSRVRAVLPAGRVSVRVVDHAGNWSSTKRIK